MMKNSISTRLMRIGRLLIWLWQTGKRLRQLDNATQSERETALREMGQACLNVLNVKMEVQHFQAASGVLVVANHVSWLDIFVLSSLYPSSFIAMKEIQNWPIIGKMVRNAGAVFIDRSNRRDIDPINAAISHTLEKGGNVCFFPEARTTLGNNILPLKAALFQAAINSQAGVLPVAMRYYSSGQRTEETSFSGVNLLVSLWKIVSLPEIMVRVDCGDSFVPTQDRFATKDYVEQFLREHVLADSPNSERVLPE